MEKVVPKNVLCVCLGNSERSPVMAAILTLYLWNTKHKDVVCESAGIDDAAKSGAMAPFGIAAAMRLGVDLSVRQKRHIGSVNLKEYDLYVCANDEIAGRLINLGVPKDKVYNAQISNPWPVQFQEDFDTLCMPVILTSMYRVVTHYFSPE